MLNQYFFLNQLLYPIHFICRPPTICAPKIYFSYLKPPSPTFEFFCLVPLQCELHISCEVTHPHARVGRVGPWPGCYGPDLAWIALSGLDFRPVYVKYGLWLGAGWLAGWLAGSTIQLNHAWMDAIAYFAVTWMHM